MKIGLNVYGTTFSMGIHPQSSRPLITPEALMDRAAAAGLEGVEFPPTLMKGLDPAAVRRYAEERGLFITMAAGGFDPHVLGEAIDLAARLGARTVRTVVGGAQFGGDRRPMAGRWQPFLRDVLRGLQAATAIAERAGVNLAIENHQDLAGEEILHLCETIGSERFGVNLDTGSPLATAEEPITYARRMVPYLKNVHLKDYWIYLSEEGYRLVRCPLGQGVMDFPALFALFRESCPDVTMSIEVGALEARHVRVLADDYWPEYPHRTAVQLAQVLRFVNAAAKPMADWRTPFERQEPVDAIVAYEERELSSSVAYIKPALAAARGVSA